MTVANIPANASNIPRTAIARNSSHVGGLSSMDGCIKAVIAKATPAIGAANHIDPKIERR